MEEIRPIKYQSLGKLRELNNDYWNKINHAGEMGKQIAWCSAMVPWDIMAAMDFLPIFGVGNAANSSLSGVSTSLLELTEAEGYPVELCTYARADIGGAMMGEESPIPGKPPKPDLVVVADGQCHSINKWHESLRNIWGVPAYLVNVPMLHGDTNEEDFKDIHSYIVEQLKEFIVFLEGFTGRRLDYDRLQQSLTQTKKQCMLWDEILQMRKNTPSPMSIFDMWTHIFPILGHRGTPEGVAYYETLKEEVAERVANNVGAVPDERHRIHFDGIPIWFEIRKLFATFASYGTNAITHPYPLMFDLKGLDPSNPLDSTASIMLNSYINAGMKQRSDILVQSVREYSLDGVIMGMTRTCKTLALGIFDIAEKIEKETGVPSLIVETEQCDTRAFSDSQFYLSVETFLETLDK